jgi:cytochrome c peroxidase
MIRDAASWLGGLTLILAILPAHAEPPANGPGVEGPSVPLALAWGSNGRLLVALRDARRIAMVDPTTWRVVDHRELPFRPNDLVVTDDHETILVGGMNGQILALDRAGQSLKTWTPGKGPLRVVALPGGRAAVASPWDRAVRLIDWRGGRVEAVHSLGFAPGAMVLRPDGRLIVADAFQGRIADLKPGQVGSERIRSFDGVNLHALALSGDGKELLLGHMAAYDMVPLTRTNIDWGLVLSSRLSAVRLSALDEESAGDQPLPRRRISLDGSAHGAADPSAMAVSPDGTQVVVALAGAHQLLKNDRRLGASTSETADLLPLGQSQKLAVAEVGRTPVAVLLDPSGTLAVTADAMSDTLTVVRLLDLAILARVDLGPEQPVRSPAQRGEAHFRDARRGFDRWMSCASCHPSGHTQGLNFDTLGDGGYGAAKNTPSLLGVGATAPFAWTGRFPALGDQVRQSLLTSLHGPSAEPEVVEELTAYLASLDPPPARRAADDPSARRGAEVFRAQRCDTCHSPPLYTSAGTRDVGLDDGPGGHRRFNPPSLLGVGWSAPYLHDGRAASLGEVLDLHRPGQPEPWSSQEREDLIAFLESL